MATWSVSFRGAAQKIIFNANWMIRGPPGEPIPAVQLAAFRASRDRLFAQLSATVLADTARKPDAVKAAAAR